MELPVRSLQFASIEKPNTKNQIKIGTVKAFFLFFQLQTHRDVSRRVSHCVWTGGIPCSLGDAAVARHSMLVEKLCTLCHSLQKCYRDA